MDNFQPELPRRVELWENVLAALRTAILKGELPPQTRLVEAELSEKLGVSRGPVREALSRLEQEGLVEGLPRRGTVVVGLTDDDIREVFAMRILLESYGARLAAEKATDDEIASLQARLDEMVELAGQGQVRDLGERDIEFHRLVLMATKNRRLLSTWEPLAGTARTMLVITEGVYHDQRGPLDQHQRLVDAIRRHDPDGAERIMREHMGEGERMILSIKNDDSRAEPTLGRPLTNARRS